MKRNLIAVAVLTLLASMQPVRAQTRDVAFTYRMGAGFPGDVNRTHPASIVPGMNHASQPARLYGDPVVTDTATNTYRGFQTGDTALTRITGIVVRPYPIQMRTGGDTAAIGTAAAPANGNVMDVLDDGFIMARCNNFATQQPTKDGLVYVWCAVSSGAHVQGGFESVASGGNTAAIANARWNGPCDSNGIGEIIMDRT